MTVHKQKNIELKKHVSTIHCSNSLSLLQRKIANALLYHAYDGLLRKDEHEISIRELCLLIGYESHDYKTIKKALVDLLSTVIEWNIIAEDATNDDQHQWNASSIIADASICNGVCTYSYSNKMKQLLYTPSIYGRLNMAIQAKFKSSYGLALYENAIRYQNLKQTPWFDMEIFRKLMGVSENTYLIFRDFKRRVLEKAVAEVNAFSPIFITPRYKKDRRTITAIRFEIQQNSNCPQQRQQKFVEDGPLLNKLVMEYGLTDKQIDNICQQYAPAYIKEKVKLIESSHSFREGKILNLAKYLVSALQENYQQPRQSKVTVSQKPSDLLLSNEYSVIQIQQKKAYANFIAVIFENFILQLSSAEKKQLEMKFADYLNDKGSDFLIRLYRKDKLRSKFVEMEFRQFLRMEFPSKLANIPRLEEFLQQTEEKK